MGWTMRVARGRVPTQTPTGTQIRVAMAMRMTMRVSVARPRAKAWPISAGESSAITKRAICQSASAPASPTTQAEMKSAARCCDGPADVLRVAPDGGSTFEASAQLGSISRTVRVTGEYDAVHQLLIDNKIHAGRAGFEVVAPLKLAGGSRYVLIDRGWIRQAARRAELPQVPPPTGMVTVTGRVNLPPRRYIELKAGPPSGPVWQNLDIDRIAAATGLLLLPIVVEQLEPMSAPDGLVRDWPPPDTGSEQHRGYMLQWYLLAALAIGLWLVLNWRPPDSAHGSA